MIVSWEGVAFPPSIPPTYLPTRQHHAHLHLLSDVGNVTIFYDLLLLPLLPRQSIQGVTLFPPVAKWLDWFSVVRLFFQLVWPFGDCLKSVFKLRLISTWHTTRPAQLTCHTYSHTVLHHDNQWNISCYETISECVLLRCEHMRWLALNRAYTILDLV